MASQPVEESRLSKIINGVSPWISVLVIFIYTILCLIATTLYAFKLTLPAQVHPIITILWTVANTLGVLLLAMTIYGWAFIFWRRPRSNSSAASKAVSGARTGLASVVSRTVLLVASSVLVITAVAPQHALDIYNQPPPAHTVPLVSVLALVQSSPSGTLTPTTTPTSVLLPVMKNDFLSNSHRCDAVATDLVWTLTNSAVTASGQTENTAVNWVAFVGDTHFAATPISGRLGPNQTATIHVRGPVLPPGKGLYLSLYVTDAALDYTDITIPVQCV